MLLNLNIKKSAGSDGIPNAFLRRYAEQISGYLTKLFNLSITTGDTPSDWRIARVKPIYKKGDRLSVNNYRPVSVISTCCKLLEHAVARYIQEFSADRNVLSPHQHGFRRSMSTVTQLVSNVHEILGVLDVSGQVDMVFLDFSKAFDKVPHGKLLYKLECLGLPSFIVTWIGAYLSNRSQFVEVKNCSSPVLPVTSGVPQGSVLGPLLFLIYVNDLIQVVSGTVSIRLFADDCVVFEEISCTNDHILLQNSICAIGDWCKRWGMILNSDKTVLLRVTRKKRVSAFTYSINNKPVTEVDKFKYLGVTLTNKFTWSEHISDICIASLRKLWFLKRKLKNAPIGTKLLAYNACIRSKLEYASVVWDPNYKKIYYANRKSSKKGS